VSVAWWLCELRAIEKHPALQHVRELPAVEVVKVESMVHMGVKKWLLIITIL
jgi:hypothetical protein